MGKEAVFTMKLEPELRDAFMEAAQRLDRPASQIMREMMRDFIETHEDPDQEYWDFVQRKVDRGRADIAAGRTHSSEEVEAHFAAKRAALHKKAGGNA